MVTIVTMVTMVAMVNAKRLETMWPCCPTGHRQAGHRGTVTTWRTPMRIELRCVSSLRRSWCKDEVIWGQQDGGVSCIEAEQGTVEKGTKMLDVQEERGKQRTSN
jgi:hypothetical protein